MNLLEENKTLSHGSYALAFERLACHPCNVWARRGVLCGVPVGPDGCPKCGRPMRQVSINHATVFDGCVWSEMGGYDDGLTDGHVLVAPAAVGPVVHAKVEAAPADRKETDPADRKEAAAGRAKAMDKATPFASVFEGNYGHAVGTPVAMPGVRCPVVAHAVFEATCDVLELLHNAVTGNLIAVPVDTAWAPAAALPLFPAYETRHPVPPIGAAFRHFKGGTYQWYGLAAAGFSGPHPFLPGPLVVYRSDKTSSLWVRTLDDFYADVTDRVYDKDGPTPPERVTRFAPAKDYHAA